MKRKLATLLGITLLAATTAVAAPQPPVASPATTDWEQAIEDLSPAKQAQARKLLSAHAERVHALIKAERMARLTLESVLASPKAKPRAIDEATQALIERQAEILKERVAFRIKLAAETGLRFPLHGPGLGTGSHGNGAADLGDRSQNRPDNGKTSPETSTP